MNATKSKQLRALAKRITNSTTLTKTFATQGLPPQFQSVLGMAIKVQRGIPKQLDHSCPHKIYKNLKRDYKAFKSSSDQSNYHLMSATL